MECISETRLEQENKSLKAKLKLAHDTAETYKARAVKADRELQIFKGALEAIIDMAGCCTGEDAQNMLETAEYALKLKEEE